MIRFLLFLTLFAAPASAMEFKFVSNGGNCYFGCAWLSAEGPITKDSPAKLLAAIEENEFNRNGQLGLVLLNSPGGSLFAGMELGRIFRERGAHVTIGSTVPIVDSPWFAGGEGVCISACAYAFLGGLTREIGAEGFNGGTGKLGFHQFAVPDALEQPDLAQFTATDRIKDQIITGRLVEYINEMGVDARIYQFAAAVPPNKIAILDPDLASEYNVTTSAAPYQDWKLIAFEKGLIAESQRGGLNPRTLRFYCAGDKVHLTYLQDNEASVNGVYRDHTFYKIAPALFAGETPLNARLNGVYGSAKTKRDAIVFDLSKQAAQAVIQHSSVGDRSDVPRVVSLIYAELSVGTIPGDTRLLEAALRNCIN